MKLKRPGQSTYAIAIRDGDELWLALWIKRSAKPEYFIFHPTNDGNENPHSSLHHDGTFHLKSHDKVMLDRPKQSPATVISLGVRDRSAVDVHEQRDVLHGD